MANDKDHTTLPSLPEFLNGTAEQPEEQPASLRDQLQMLIHQSTVLDPKAAQVTANAVMHLLSEEGHFMPGTPPARQILRDAQQFAGQYMLAVLCVRLLRMLDTRIETPETKGMRRWLEDYLDGKNHGPIGKPMLWPSGLPGLAAQMREWGYQPTPTRPPYVTRAPAAHVLN